MTSPSGETPTGDVPVCYRHPSRETYIRCSRCERPICPDCMTAVPVGFQCPECISRGTRGVREARTPLGGKIRERGTLVTMILIGINVGVWLTNLLAGGRQLVEWFALARLTFFVEGDPPTLIGVEQGEWYRMITAAFLHEQVWHIGLNMLALWILGSSLEPVMGRWRFLLLYLLSALGGSAASLLVMPTVDVAAGVAGQIGYGASGAVFGLFGALFVIARRLGRDVSFVLVILGINVVIGFTVPGIDWRAHLGGLVAGGVLAAVFAHAPTKHRATYGLVASGLLLAGVVAVVAVAVA